MTALPLFGAARRALLAAAVLLAAAAEGAVGQPAALERVPIEAEPVTEFHIGFSEKMFGPLEFNGGLVMTSSASDLGALSSLRFLDAGMHFVGVADTGFWFFGRVERDGAGHPSGIADFRMQPMEDARRAGVDRKQGFDAESLAVRGGVAVVGFERDQRISRVRLGAGGMGTALGDVPFPIPVRELRQNRSFEGLDFRADGSLVVVTEKSLDPAGNFFAAVLSGPGKGVFKIKRDDPFDLSDCALLPNGDLLLLERSFSFAAGVAIRLRRIPADSVKAGVLADGPVLMGADMGYQIDNMEGLAVWRRADGALVLSMVSDDNRSILQRNLYLEFILHEDRFRGN